MLRLILGGCLALAGLGLGCATSAPPRVPPVSVDALPPFAAASVAPPPPSPPPQVRDANIAGAPAADAEAVIGAFGQDAAKNCASIAVIKAAMVRFGSDKLFTSTPASGGTTVHMRDGVDVLVTPGDIANVIAHSGFKLLHDRALFDEANLALAAMAARLAGQHENLLTHCNPDGSLDGNRKPHDQVVSTTAAAACILNNDGLYFALAPHLLGLTRFMVDVPGGSLMHFFHEHSFLNRGTACVAASAGHAWFVSQGLADKYGTPTAMFGLANEFGRAGGLRAGNAYCFGWPE